MKNESMKQQTQKVAGTAAAQSCRSGILSMTSGSIWRAVPRFAVTVAIASILEQLFTVCDVAVAGNFAGQDATAVVAAVGANVPVVALAVNLLVGISLGANVVVATAVGARDAKAAQAASATAVIAALVGGVLIAAVGEFFAGALLSVLQVPDDVFPLALAYLRVYLAGIPAVMLYNLQAAVFRGIGQARAPLVPLVAANVLNAVLDVLFVSALGAQAAGLAAATALSYLVSALILLYRITHAESMVRLGRKTAHVDAQALAAILKIGLPAGVQGAVFAVSNIIVQAAIDSLGQQAIAASTAAYSIEILVYFLLNSFGQACATFVGQNRGARNAARCRKTLAACLGEGLATVAVAIALVLVAGKFMLALVGGPDVVELGYVRLMFVFSAYAFSTMYEVLSGYLRGFGITLVPSVLVVAGVCGVRLAWIAAVFPAYGTFQAIMCAYPVSLFATAVLLVAATVLYRPASRMAQRERKG